MSTRKSRNTKNFKPSEVRESINVKHGKIIDCEVTLFSIMRDEYYFLPAFLNYHRSLGVEQFIILDDKSTDQTREFLIKQQDVVVLESNVRYGDLVTLKDMSSGRAGPLFKEIIPDLFLKNKFSLYLDADEFLFLPPSISTIGEVINYLTAKDELAIGASLVEFFPKRLQRPIGQNNPSNFEELLKSNPFFEPIRLLNFSDNGWLKYVNKSKSEQLFEQFMIGSESILKKIERRVTGKKLRLHSAKMKTPLVYQGKNMMRTGSHATNIPPAQDLLLTIGHFVFTDRLSEKIEKAQLWQSHSGAGRKYTAYALLLEKMRSTNSSFLSNSSTRFKSTTQFLESGLMIWP